MEPIQLNKKQLDYVAGLTDIGRIIGIAEERERTQKRAELLKTQARCLVCGIIHIRCKNPNEHKGYIQWNEVVEAFNIQEGV
jgi:succinate dehydrogenase/fumarate reductase-like Fe-S protein